MAVTVLLIGVTIFFAISCVVLRSQNKSFEGMICKFMASFSFLSVAIYGNLVNNGSHLDYFSLICIALLFGLFGDVFLGIKEVAPSFRKKLIPTGTVYFMISHIVTIVALSGLYGMAYISIPFFGVGVILAIAVIKLAKMKISKSLVPALCIYYGLLVWKIAFSIWLVHQEVNTGNILILISSVLFIASDSFLGILYFTPIKRKNLFVTAELSTYYPAQILLALSVLFR